MIKGKFKVIKTVYHSEGFNIYGVEPLEMIEGKAQLNRYHNATIKTSMDLTPNHIYTLTLNEHQDKYGIFYSIIATGLDFASLEDITPELHLDLLRELTSVNLAENIHKAYPNFIHLVLTDRVDEIDVNNIKGVKYKLLAKFVHKIKTNCIMFMLLASYPHLQLTPNECRSLANRYGEIENIKEALNENPYDAILTYTDRTFYKLDKILKDDYHFDHNRIKWLIATIIEYNTYDGSTYISTNTLVDKVRAYDSEVVEMLVDIVKEADDILYDADKDVIQYRPHYDMERKVANFIKLKIKQQKPLDWKWEDFKEVKDGVLTDEQQGALKMVCDSTLSMLIGYAGCVDCETEYFNGKQWKKISEYTKGDKVLQYNADGSANLVEPWAYIKEPCNMMYHFETKYGLNQTLTPDHNVVYLTSKGNLNVKSMQEVKESNDACASGWAGKIPTTFIYNGEGIALTNDEIRIMCAVICDGSFYTNVQEHNESYMRCRFHLKKERKKERLRQLCANANIPLREHESKDEGYTDMYIDAPMREKVFTEYWYNCSQEQLQTICDEIIFWDGNVRYTKSGKPKRAFSTSIKETAEFIQFAFSACGLRASISINDRRNRTHITNGKVYQYKSIEYTVIITDRIYCGMSVHMGDKVEILPTTPKDGYKYCFTVPSHMLVLRRANKIFITGNCGKTSTVKAILQMLEAYDQTYILLAPTGKASQRLAQQTGRNASTIHRATLPILNNKGLKGDEAKGLLHDWIIIDEMSMVSLDVMQMVIDAVDDIERTRFLFIGDSGQIPSIGMGAILRDCIESNIVPITTLTHCFRFKDGGASYVAECMRRGEPYLPNDVEDFYTMGANQDYTFIKWNGTREQIVGTYVQALNTGLRPQDVSLLIPYNKYDFGTLIINNNIQSIINPIDPWETTMKSNVDGTPIIFHKNDMVLVTKNNYKAVKWQDYDDGMFDDMDIVDIKNEATGTVYNGQIGVITQMVNGGMVVKIEGESFVFLQDDLQHLRLGYALSVHKFQGSQAKYIINVIIPQHSNLLSRELCYTAQTRFSKKLIEIGTVDAINYAMGIAEQDNRMTRLKEFLLTNTQ